jgi:TRAP-type mannitol/chloroaromatic compound transport system permease large subunit
MGRTSAHGLPGGEVGFLIVVNVLFSCSPFSSTSSNCRSSSCPCSGRWRKRWGIDLIWFGVLLAVNMQTSFMHPPFGFALFYLRSVAPASVKTTDIYWERFHSSAFRSSWSGC